MRIIITGKNSSIPLDAMQRQAPAGFWPVIPAIEKPARRA